MRQVTAAVVILAICLFCAFGIYYGASRAGDDIDQLVNVESDREAAIAAATEELQVAQKRLEELYRDCKHDGRLIIDREQRPEDKLIGQTHVTVTCARCNKVLKQKMVK
jgi:hypothetical protein